jgi:hypothetical protein
MYKIFDHVFKNVNQAFEKMLNNYLKTFDQPFEKCLMCIEKMLTMH